MDPAQRAVALRTTLAKESKCSLTVRHFPPARLREAFRLIAALGRAKGSVAFAFRTRFSQNFGGVAGLEAHAGAHAALYWPLYERYGKALAACAQRGVPSSAYRRAELVCYLFARLLVARVPTASQVCSAASAELAQILEMGGGAGQPEDAEKHARHILDYTGLRELGDALFVRRCVGGAAEMLFEMRRRGQLPDDPRRPWTPPCAGLPVSRGCAAGGGRAGKKTVLGASRSAACAPGRCVVVFRFLTGSPEAGRRPDARACETGVSASFPVDRGSFEHHAVAYAHVPSELLLTELEETVCASYADVAAFVRGEGFVAAYDSGCHGGRGRVHLIRHGCLPRATVGDAARGSAGGSPKLYVLMVPSGSECFLPRAGPEGFPFEVKWANAPDGASLQFTWPADDGAAAERLEATLAKAFMPALAGPAAAIKVSHRGACTERGFRKPTAEALAKCVSSTLGAKVCELQRRGDFSPGLMRFFIQNVFTVARVEAA